MRGFVELSADVRLEKEREISFSLLIQLPIQVYALVALSHVRMADGLYIDYTDNTLQPSPLFPFKHPLSPFLGHRQLQREHHTALPDSARVPGIGYMWP